LAFEFVFGVQNVKIDDAYAANAQFSVEVSYSGNCLFVIGVYEMEIDFRALLI